MVSCQLNFRIISPHKLYTRITLLFVFLKHTYQARALGIICLINRCNGRCEFRPLGRNGGNPALLMSSLSCIIRCNKLKENVPRLFFLNWTDTYPAIIDRDYVHKPEASYRMSNQSMITYINHHIPCLYGLGISKIDVTW